MSFEDVLKRRLGAFSELFTRGPEAEDRPDPATLYYRRAAGIEVRARPDESWNEVVLASPAGDLHRVSLSDALTLIGLSRWQHARDISLSPASLWREVERDLLFWSRTDPGVPLVGETGVLPDLGDRPLARRRAMWPTVAVETAIEIAPFPFMPRGRDLAGAQVVGLRLDARERGFEVFGATITGTPATGELLRRLVPLLDGTRTAKEIDTILGPRFGAHRVERLLGLLDGFGVLEAAEPRPMQGTLQSKQGPQVTWLGHAAVLVQASGRSVLVDPLFFAGSEPEELWLSAPRFDPRDLPPIDLILISHGDNDHLNPTALLQLDPSTPVVIPRGAQPAPAHQVDIRGTLGLLHFDRVIELAPWETFDVGPLRVTACPFVGESWDLELAQATYLIESPELSAFFSADAYRMDDTYRRLAARERPIDVAFMGVSGCAESFAMPRDLGYGNFYRDFVPRVRHNEWVQHCAGPKDALESLRLFRPRFAAGYAAGGASYIRTQYSDTGDHETLARLVAGAREPGVFETDPLRLEIGTPHRLA